MDLRRRRYHGVAELDAQHEELFRRVDRLLDAMSRARPQRGLVPLAFLQRHVKDDSRPKERLMRELAYPDAALHAAEHLAFAAEIAALRSRVRARGGATARLVLRLEREVTGWLRITSIDQSCARPLRPRAARRQAPVFAALPRLCAAIKAAIGALIAARRRVPVAARRGGC